MDIVSNNLYGGLKLQPPIPTPLQSSITFPPPHLPYYSSDTSFPIIAIAIIGTIATAFLLVSYYIFVIKCCLNWHSINLLNHFPTSFNQNQDDPLMDATFETSSRGLEDSVIRSIPMFKFGKEATKLGSNSERSICICECVVCLNEFQEDERLRIIPNCSHVFHVDCIDAWLKNNANCPLCRTSIFGSNVIAPSSTTPQDPTRSEEEEEEEEDDDYVVIELGDYSNVSTQEKLNPGELSAVARRISPCPRKLDVEQRGVKKIWRKFSEVGSMGDECIDDVRIRSHDDEFGLIQPIRRSISMDSLVDGHLCLGVQEIDEGSTSNSSSSRRCCFSFGHGCRGSGSAILPVKFET